jgi:EpsI family protein
MIAYGNAVLSDNDKAWQTLLRVDRTVRVDGRELPVREWVIGRGNEQRLVWSWYAVGGSFTRSEYKVKALTAWAMLSGAGDHSTVMVLSTRLPEREFGVMTNAQLPGVIDARERLARELSKSEIISKLESGFVRK